MTLADVKPSVVTLLTFFALWLLVGNLAKMIFVNKYYIKGLSDLVKNITG